jgi:ATP-dependent helicase/nuclease subunit A
MRLRPARPGEPPLFAWSRKAEDCRAVGVARDERREAESAEHRRLLYVAMTRAAQRLVVAGFETTRGRREGCWHELVELGLGDAMTDAPAHWTGDDRILRFGESLEADDGGETPHAGASGSLPGWLSTKVEPEAAALPLRPSSRSVHTRDSERVAEGQLAHALLQMLPGTPPQHRAAAAKAYLEAHGGALSEAARGMLAAQVVRVIEAPELLALFGPGSRGEAPLAGVLRRTGRPDAPYSGRLDRLLVTKADILIVDFKLGAAPPQPSAAHIAQLAVYRAALRPLYPTLPVRAALVYLDGPTLRPIDAADLDRALDAFEAS